MWNLFLRGTSSGWNQALGFLFFQRVVPGGIPVPWGGCCFRSLIGKIRDTHGSPKYLHCCQANYSWILWWNQYCTSSSAPDFCFRAPRMIQILPLPLTAPRLQESCYIDQGPSFLIYNTEIQTRSLSQPWENTEDTKCSRQSWVWAGKCGFVQGSPQ